jgi:hypothetical protein
MQMTSVCGPNLYDGRTLSTKLLRTHPRSYVGVDLGQAQDHSAIAVVERAEALNPVRDPLTWSFPFDSRFHVRHVERIELGAPYPEVVEHVKQHPRCAADCAGIRAVCLPQVELELAVRRGSALATVDAGSRRPALLPGGASLRSAGATVRTAMAQGDVVSCFNGDPR